MVRFFLATLIGGAALALSPPAFAADETEVPQQHLSVAYAADVMSTLAGGWDRKGRTLDNLDLLFGTDPEALPGRQAGAGFPFDKGVLAIAEGALLGRQGKAKFAVGAWTYDDRRDDIRPADGQGDPLDRTARGAYLVAEYPLNGVNGPQALTAFVRAGVSDGRTTPYSGGWQAGLLVSQAITGRKDSQLSLGIARATVNAGYRANLANGGSSPARSETQIELTYSDLLYGTVTVQPEIQYVFNPGGDRAAPDAVVAGLRLDIAF